MILRLPLKPNDFEKTRKTLQLTIRAFQDYTERSELRKRLNSVLFKLLNNRDFVGIRWSVGTAKELDCCTTLRCRSS
ncbi:hypothetical protein GE061_003773 [Apolygus lucorum]|uniref:Uncharacterized protein n=1 Tax=Apolygus lucorum TaxID=248454 RepID=A0A6A4JJK2_APOLU|nr:hypothetical protein GE061_003773 [Apolygus lucorum]